MGISRVAAASGHLPSFPPSAQSLLIESRACGSAFNDRDRLMIAVNGKKGITTEIRWSGGDDSAL